METSLWFYAAFTAFILTMLALDLGIFHRHAHAVRPKEAAMWVAIWVTLALLFAGGLYFWRGGDTTLLFLTGYLIEQSLSIDNIFVIVMIFAYFKVPPRYQHRVLFWGIVGALVMRGLLIGVGVLLIERFGWIMYLFGAFLIFAGVKMALQREGEAIDAENNIVIRAVRRFIRVTHQYDGQKFFTILNGRRLATPLFLVLVVIEFTDLVFAVDSIPAIFAVTTDPFIVYTSNVFAILGLRSMYFLLASMVERFVYLKYGLAVILTFVGLKMVAADIVHVPTVLSLLVILATLGISVGVSLKGTVAARSATE